MTRTITFKFRMNKAEKETHILVANKMNQSKGDADRILIREKLQHLEQAKVIECSSLHPEPSDESPKEKPRHVSGGEEQQPPRIKEICY
jgi:hypothetical protein